MAIVDPPYGIGNTTTSKGNKNRRTLHKKIDWNDSIPSKEYFDELYRISRNQIIWGANYYWPHVAAAGRIVFYKRIIPSEDGMRYCPCEISSQSFNKRVEFYEHTWIGNRQGDHVNWDNSGTDRRIHPTQKPVCLYRWLLVKYAKPGQKIFDSHVGSGSLRMACFDLRFDFEGCEINGEIGEAQEQRYRDYIRQPLLIGMPEIRKQIMFGEFM